MAASMDVEALKRPLEISPGGEENDLKRTKANNGQKVPVEHTQGGESKQAEGDNALWEMRRYAITFGEVAILHTGGEEYGEGIREEGFTVAELSAAAAAINANGGNAELVDVSAVLPSELRCAETEASVLVVRNGAAVFGCDADALLAEQDAVAYDRKFFNTRRSVTQHKRARFNIVFGEEDQAHSEDYTQCTVQAFAGVPSLATFRSHLSTVLGPKAESLMAEGNYYYARASGIGFHGDSERKVGKLWL